MTGWNVPDDWDRYYSTCSRCGTRVHASEGGCGTCGEEGQDLLRAAVSYMEKLADLLISSGPTGEALAIHENLGMTLRELDDNIHGRPRGDH